MSWRDDLDLDSDKVMQALDQAWVRGMGCGLTVALIIAGAVTLVRFVVALVYS